MSRRRWISRQHFLDLVGTTNLIPGPNSTEMTMQCGRERAGVAGLFLPSFVFVLLLDPLVPRLRRSPSAAAVLDGVNVGAVAVMAAVTLELGRDVLVDWQPWTLALLGASPFLVRGRSIRCGWC